MVFRSLRNRFLGKGRRRKGIKSKLPTRQRRLAVESLEDRRLLTLIGITPNFPLVAYDSTGSFQYNATTHTFDVTASPLALQLNAASPPIAIGAPRDLEIHALIDNSGNLISGNGTPNDFFVTGTVTVSGHTYAGTAATPLLTGHILQFGWQYNAGTSTAQFDYRFQATGGEFITDSGPLQSSFVGADIGVTMASEHSNSFTGSFENDFSGGAKGNVGPIAPLPVALFGYKFNDLNDNGVDNSEPRLSGWTINLTGTDDLGHPVSMTTVTGANGQYSFTGLVPGTYTVTEVQQTGWMQTTGGATVTLTSGQVAVAIAGEAGTLPPGETEVVTPLLAFGNFKPTSIVIGNGKSPVTPQTVNTFSPLTGAPGLSPPIIPFGTTFMGGVNVATGDLNQNGFDDIVTAPNRTGTPVIKVYDQLGNLLTSFQAYPASFNGGVQVAVADLNGDGLKDIVTVPSFGPAEVRVFYNKGVAGGAPVFSSTPSLDFLAFPSTFIGGAVVAASSLGTMGNGVPQIIVGSAAGMKATIEVFNVNSIVSSSPPKLAVPTATFTPFNNIAPPLQGGVSLATARLSSAPNDSIVVGAGTGGQSLVNIWGWNGSSYQPLSASGVIGFHAFSGASANAPVNVAVLNNPQGIATAILAVQGEGGTTGQLNQLNITSVSPLVLSAPVTLPGNFPGPSTIAVINNVQPGATPAPVAKPVAKPTTTVTTTTTFTTKAPTTSTPTTTTTTSTTKPVTTTTTTAPTTTTTTTKPANSAAAVVTTSTRPSTTLTTAAALAAYFASLGRK
jgi:hypothetical protein